MFIAFTVLPSLKIDQQVLPIYVKLPNQTNQMLILINIQIRKHNAQHTNTYKIYIEYIYRIH